MWIMSTIGNFSIVTNQMGPGLMIRARLRDDLVRLAALPSLPKLGGIVETPNADYAFRIVLAAEQLAPVMVALGALVDYPNFKSAVGKRLGPDREHPLHAVWSTMVADAGTGHYAPRRWGFGGQTFSDTSFGELGMYDGPKPKPKPARRKAPSATQKSLFTQPTDGWIKAFCKAATAGKCDAIVQRDHDQILVIREGLELGRVTFDAGRASEPSKHSYWVGSLPSDGARAFRRVVAP